jgi:hypothetical protein
MKTKPQKNTIEKNTKKNTIVLSDGIEVELRPVPRPFIEIMLNNLDFPSPPVYVVTAADGTTQKIAYDEKSIEDAPDADKLLYLQYLAESAQKQNEYSTRFMKVMLREGSRVADALLRDDAPWIRRQKNFLEIPVPDDIDERRYHYIKTELVRSDEDAGEVLAAIMDVSGVNRELVTVLRESFRSAIQTERNKPMPEEIKSLVNQ